ncbi:MAG: sensor histidine kinase [Candidatus Nitrosomaritimum yanchengensis]
MSEALSLVTQLQTYSFIGFAIIGAMVSATLYGSSTLITRPILKLYDKTSQMKDLDVELKPEGPFEVRELIHSFNEMMKKQKELDQQKDEFSSMISHELKTPLVTMKGHLQMLQENMLGELSKEQKEAIDEIQEKSNELWRLIEDILDVKNILIGNISFEKEPIEIKKFIHKIINSTDIPKEKDVEIVSTTHYNIVISSDKTRLSQVFSKLIKNAIEHVPTKKGKIEISAIPKDDSVLFCVKDNGHGIPIDELKHIFKKYYQVDSSETRKHGGLGLGLVICQGIVEGLGGNIWVESEGVGKGTSFFFTIPKN